MIAFTLTVNVPEPIYPEDSFVGERELRVERIMMQYKFVN